MSGKQHPPVVLVIAGNDPSGGAGICADTQAITALRAHPAPVLSALTVQDTINAYAVDPVSPAFVVDQAERVLADLAVRAIKLGLLASAETGEAVADLLERFRDIPVVTDPVLVAAGGAALAEEQLIDTYLKRILPLTTVLTPNAHELRALAPQAADNAARVAALLALGPRAVLAKGGDEDTPDVENTLHLADGKQQEWKWQRLAGEHHGSGCTLASAIAARLAHGDEPIDAVDRAQQFTFAALRDGWQLGRGQNIPNRQSE